MSGLAGAVSLGPLAVSVVVSEALVSDFVATLVSAGVSFLSDLLHDASRVSANIVLIVGFILFLVCAPVLHALKKHQTNEVLVGRNNMEKHQWRQD